MNRLNSGTHPRHWPGAGKCVRCGRRVMDGGYCTGCWRALQKWLGREGEGGLWGVVDVREVVYMRKLRYGFRLMKGDE